mmetsp:Transcript_60401/g.168775  ORF Transcript_60401/g.168775 Transcript_60401/m.168775 type:complete len:241 (+) Transcript_60401:431-1153(+)
MRKCVDALRQCLDDELFVATQLFGREGERLPILADGLQHDLSVRSQRLRRVLESKTIDSDGLHDDLAVPMKLHVCKRQGRAPAVTDGLQDEGPVRAHLSWRDAQLPPVPPHLGSPHVGVHQVGRLTDCFGLNAEHVHHVEVLMASCRHRLQRELRVCTDVLRSMPNRATILPNGSTHHVSVGAKGISGVSQSFAMQAHRVEHEGLVREELGRRVLERVRVLPHGAQHCARISEDADGRKF